MLPGLGVVKLLLCLHYVTAELENFVGGDSLSSILEPMSQDMSTDAACENAAESDDHRSTRTHEQSACGDSGSTREHCYQIVPYEPVKIIPAFEVAQRRFHFAGREWVISQQWREVGLSAVVWEAAVELCRYLEALGSSCLEGRRVIELGAGTGLVGMVASALGAHSVTLTDRNTASAEANLNANQHNVASGGITVAPLEWGQDVSQFSPPFDLILAADVVYEEPSFCLLARSLQDLSGPGTTILLAHKHRYEKGNQFFGMLSETFDSKLVWSEGDLKIFRMQKKN